jgi:hypothetical protein
MTAETIARTIQLILAPVVMVSACAILTGGILSHYAAINDRLRALTRERLELLRGPDGALSVALATGDAFKQERLGEIDRQLPELARRLELVHHALLAVYGAILIFVLSMFVIALAALGGSAALAGAALVVFLVGTAVMLTGVLLVALEIRRSNDAIQYEVHRVMQVGMQAEGPERAPCGGER